MGPLTSTGKLIKISLYIIHIHIHYTLHVSDTLQVSRNQFKLYMMTIVCVDNLSDYCYTIYTIKFIVQCDKVATRLSQGSKRAKSKVFTRLWQGNDNLVTT